MFQKTWNYIQDMRKPSPELKIVGTKQFMCSVCETTVEVHLMLKANGSSSKSYERVASGCKCGQFNKVAR